MKTKSIFMIFAFLLLTSTVFAKTSLNSVCYIQGSPGSVLQGEHTKDLFEIASLSKLFTTYWALHELGAQYRFQTQIHVTPVSASVVDVHVEGSLDPFWGRQLTHFLISELYALGIREVRKFTFDENFKLRWSVLISHEKPLTPTTDEIAAGLALHFKNLAAEYPLTFQEAQQTGLNLSQVETFTVKEVSYLSSTDFKKSPRTISRMMRSAPLYRYLKEMNVVSNNHIADKLYEILGGSEKFQRFYQRELRLDTRQLQFVNGSGNSILVGQGPGGEPLKLYNRGTCESLLQVLVALQNEVTQRQSLALTDVMAVAGTDPGTLKPRYDALPNSIVAKTGTVDPTVALSGVLSTERGEIYFAVLMKTEGVVDWEKARNEVRDRVFDMVQKFGGPRPFPYMNQIFLPFDAGSGFQDVGLVSTRP